MALIVPHKIRIQGHTAIPHLFRATCSCGWKAFSAFEHYAQQAAKEHLTEEEAFPDWSFLADDPKVQQ